MFGYDLRSKQFHNILRTIDAWIELMSEFRERKVLELLSTPGIVSVLYFKKDSQVVSNSVEERR